MKSDIQEPQFPVPTLSSLEIDENIHQKVMAFAGLGGIAGLLMEGSLHPLDTVRTRIKCNAKETVGLMSEIKKMYKVEGPRSYFNGFSCTATGALVTNVTYFYTYEKLKHTFCKAQLLSKETAPFVAGFIGAFLANMVNLPFDVIRTRMQLPPGQYDYRNVYDGAKKVLKHEGVRKLYLGGPAFFTLNALEMGLTFGLYELFYKALYPYFPSKFEVNIPLSIACSATAAGIAGFSINPLDVLVSRLQSQNTVLERQLSAGEMVRKIWRNEGLGGFFKGATGTMSYYALGALILFPTYETLKYVSGIDLSEE